MGTLTVDVKWQKELFKGIEVDTEQPPLIFKMQLFSLTGVPTERQKIMVKGGMLKDDGDWSKAGIKPGQRLMMLGTADAVPQAPKQQTVFVEDLPEDEQDTTGLKKYGAGLENLGNTCYMNSTLQCFYRVPELRSALAAYPATATGAFDSEHKLAVATKGLFGQLERSAAPVQPFAFLMQLREKYPQFAQQNREGAYMQQDAEECWAQLMFSLKGRLKDPVSEGDPVIDQLFGIKLHTSLKCEEGDETIEEDSTAYSLKCNISIEVNHLAEGIKLGLQDDREKNSSALGRLALFKGASLISRLPPYLTVQMVRFFYKVDVQQKAKILRKVAFPLLLDCYDYCTPKCQKELEGPRDALNAIEEQRAGIAKKQKLDKEAETEAAKAASAKPKAAAAPSTGAAAAAADTEMADAEASSSSREELIIKHTGAMTGRYELVAVLTHKGRSADSGHYVAWVKQDDGQWVQFDDEELLTRKEDEVLALSGGGDWHMAYLLLYRAQRVKA